MSPTFSFRLTCKSVVPIRPIPALQWISMGFSRRCKLSNPSQVLDRRAQDACSYELEYAPRGTPSRDKKPSPSEAHVESQLSLVEQANDRTNSKLSVGLPEPGVNYGFSILAFAVLISVWVFVRRQVAA